MRKRETIVVPSTGGPPATLTFQRLTLGQEDQYRDWLRKRLADDARQTLQSFSTVMQIQVLAELCKTLGAGACTLTGDQGATHAMQGDGLKQFLRLAAAETHPDITDEALHELLAEHHEDCVRVVKALLPVKLRGDGDPK